MRKAALHNLGCKVNSYETDAMAQLLEKAGYEIVPFSEIADVYIVNTCSVTNMADRKSRQMLHKAKKQNPDAVVVATGCYVQTAVDKVKEDLAIDIIIGNNKKKEVVPILEEYFKENEKDFVIDINNTSEYEDLEISTVTEHTRAHMKIQDGCNNFCSYCIIPYARGRIRSRKMDSIREEMVRLAEKGFKEIVLTGINLGCYSDGEKTLIDVIEMADEIEGIERVRLGSLDPEVITPDFVERIGKCRKICPHFHLSLQSGCNNTLKAMNRHYTAEEYFEKCEATVYEEKLLNEISKVPVTPNMKQILTDLSCFTQYRGSLGYLYLDGKLLELLSIYLGEVFEQDILMGKNISISRTERTAIMEAKRIIDCQLAFAPSCEELSRLVHLSMTKLTRGFSLFYGMPIHQYVIEQRLTQAAQLLLEGDWNVSEVAAIVGYGKPSNFAAAFKKKYGVSPKNYPESRFV